MSGFEGPVLKGMNPFSNNTPRLTASERIRNKRDATIYQTEKQQFQKKKKCGNKNVKYYDNGTIRSMKSYKLQKSLARGNVLCEDCDDKGLLCGGVENKNALASIQMGNNTVSEFWGGGGINYFHSGPVQSRAFQVIQSDISGVWGGSTTDISKSLMPPGCALPSTTPCPYGYIENLINIPRNLDGYGITIDPNNTLFPDELCDPFRYLQQSNLRMYLVLRMPVPIKINGAGFVTQPSSCNDISNAAIIGGYAFFQRHTAPPLVTTVNIFSGIVDSLCCVGEFILEQNDPGYGGGGGSTEVEKGIFGLFDVYIQLFQVNYEEINKYLTTSPTKAALKNLMNWNIGDPVDESPTIYFTVKSAYTAFIPPSYVESFNVFQGTIPPSNNQTKYNATKQSYMSCLENGTRKINFTKNTVKQNNVITAYCTPCVPTIPPHTITIVGGATDTSSVPGYTIYTFGPGVSNSLTIDISGGFYCAGTVSLEYLVVGGGGGGGSPWAGNATNASVGGGGGGGQVETGTISLSIPGASTLFTIIVGAGGPGGIDTSATFLISGTAGIDGSGSTLASPHITVEADGGQGAPVMVVPADWAALGQICSNGGDSVRNFPTANYTGGDCSYNYVLTGTGEHLAPVVGGGGGGASENGQPGFFPPGSLVDPSGTGDASGGRGGSGVLSSISGTSTWYGPGGGGAAIAFNWDSLIFVDASGIGGSSGVVGAGGHGGPVDISGAPGPHAGTDATLFGGGGGGSSSANPGPNFPPNAALPQAAGIVGGDGMRGIIIIKVKNST